MSTRIFPSVLALAICATLVVTPAARTARAAAAHDHSQHGKLTLDHGKKWPTDQPLRNGMDNIRKLIEKQLGAIHDGRLTAAQYGELANKIEAEVGFIVANCKLAPKADAMLHLVIADINVGVDGMAGKRAPVGPLEGAGKVVTALNAYGRHFDHPGWMPIQHRRGRG